MAYRKPFKQTLACCWGYPDPDARPETGPCDLDELMGGLSIPSDDDEPPAVSPPRLRPTLQPILEEAANGAAELEPASAPAKKKPKRTPRSREAQLQALSQKELLDAHEQVRQRLLEKRKLPGHEGVQVPEAPVSPELPAARLVELILKLEKRERYSAPAHVNGFVAPAKLEGASLTLSGRWGTRLILRCGQRLGWGRLPRHVR